MGCAASGGRIVVRLIPCDGPPTCHVEADGTVVIARAPGASPEDVQRAIDAAHVPLVVEGAGFPMRLERRRPGPPPRAETKAERNRRWRRNGR